MRIACLTLLCLMIAACGGGDNSADAVSEDDKYIPSFSTAEGATEAFIRAIQTENLNLLSMCLLDDERDALLRRFEGTFKASRDKGVKWKLEQMPESEWFPEVEARAAIKLTELKDGEATGVVVGRWYVFVKTPDGSWKHSDAATRRWVKHLEDERAKAPANNSSKD